MSPSFRLILLAPLLVGLALGAACAHGKAPSAGPPATLGEPLLPEEIEVANLINEYRALRGHRALRIEPALCRAARRHSQNMARQGRLAHVLDGRGPGDRAEAEGFCGPVAENLAAGSGTTLRGYFDLWVASSPHRANLLFFATGTLGVSIASTPAGDEQYLTVNFSSTP